MSRHIIHIISMTTIAVSIFSAPLASAKQPTNPLHPSYFAAKSAANTPIAGADAMRYVEARNPLHPMFARAGKASNWHATRGISTQAYVDANNPLHPTYKRH